MLLFVQAEDGIRDLVRSRGLGDVYKRQSERHARYCAFCARGRGFVWVYFGDVLAKGSGQVVCLLYTSDAADERSSVDLGGRRIINKKKCDENAQVASCERKH